MKTRGAGGLGRAEDESSPHRGSVNTKIGLFWEKTGAGGRGDGGVNTWSVAVESLVAHWLLENNTGSVISFV